MPVGQDFCILKPFNPILQLKAFSVPGRRRVRGGAEDPHMRAALFVAALALCLSSASGQGQFTAISNVRSAWQLEGLWPDPTCPGTCNQGPWIGTTWDTASKTLLTDLCATINLLGAYSPPARRIDGNFFKFGTQVWPTGTLAAPRSSRLTSLADLYNLTSLTSLSVAAPVASRS